MEYRVKVIENDGICHTYENIVGISFYGITLNIVQRYISPQVGIDCFRHLTFDMKRYRHVKIEKMLVS